MEFPDLFLHKTIENSINHPLERLPRTNNNNNNNRRAYIAEATAKAMLTMIDAMLRSFEAKQGQVRSRCTAYVKKLTSIHFAPVIMVCKHSDS